MELYICHCETDGVNTESVSWDTVCETEELACIQAMHEIINWVNDQWDDYEEEDAKRLIDFINEGRYMEALSLWSDMSSLIVSVDADMLVTEIDPVPFIENPFEEEE